MLGTVFGKNYKYGGAKSTGDSYRYAATNLLALTRKASSGMLDDALSNASWQAQLFAQKTAKARGTLGTVVDIFA